MFIELDNSHANAVCRYVDLEGNKAECEIVDCGLYGFIRDKFYVDDDYPMHVDNIIEHLFYDKILFKDDKDNLIFLNASNRYRSTVSLMAISG